MTLLKEDGSDPEPLINSGSLEDPDTDSAGVRALGSVRGHRLYSRRWYILALYSILAGTQGSLWNTWGPISDSAKFVFGWRNSDIALLANWGPIAYMVLAVPFSWLMDVKGLRLTVLLAGFCVFAGAGIRCLTAFSLHAGTWFMNIGQLLNGAAGPVAMAAPPALSAAWFPHEQRTTATAIGITVGAILGAGSFLIGPLIVTQKPDNRTGHHNMTNAWDEQSGLSQGNSTNFSTAKNQIMLLMYVEFAWTALIFLLILAYFPDKPPSPPTLSASKDRLSFGSGVKQLVRNGRFWLVCLSYGILNGTLSSYGGLLDVNLSPHNITQVEAGWVGFYGSIAGGVSGIAVGRFSDMLGGHFRFTILVMTVGYIGSLLWLILMLYHSIIPFNTVSMYASFLLLQVCALGSEPLFFELGVESTYPIAEGVTTCVLTWVNNFFGLLLLLVMMIPRIGTDWMGWATLGSGAAVLPLMLLFRERYGRLAVDTGKRR
ncbi:solute carrier family 49 member 4 homolog [Branchiostoma lanceolatum]|uniref:solute carrier family 49 member 4 homolog n=1 Tax=Branchiostoma lanceolatum TaxID=7740 RepID=UPI003452893C